MTRSQQSIRRTRLAATTLVVFVAACGGERKSAEAPKSSMPPAEAAPAGYPAQAPTPADASSTESAARAPSVSGSSVAPHPDRSARLVQASREVDISQRELDLAGGDCQNACRALGSMDRATGHLCALAESNDEVRRCGDARTRLYSARDKVRTTCGSCPDVSVERSAPIPSR